MGRHTKLSLTTVCLLLLSPADCQRNGRLTTQQRRDPTRSREDTRGKESREISFGGFKPIPGGKGLRFPDPGGLPDPGEQDRKKNSKSGKREKQQQRPQKPQKQTQDYYQYDYDNYGDFYYYEDEEPLPSGPTQEPPLPSGPTRRPGQPTTAPVRRPTVPPIHPALNQFLNLPLLTTQSPRNSRKSTRKPQRQSGGRARNGKSPLRIPHPDIDIVDQTRQFSSQDPNQEQFIPPPPLNAGALPLAFESDLPLNNFPPYRPRKE